MTAINNELIHKNQTALARFALDTSLVSADVPEYLKEELGKRDGRDNMDKDDIVIPRLGLAQAGQSPQLKKQSELYIPDLKEGQLFNTVTGEIYGEEVYVVPLIFFKNYIEFIPMDEGGGVKAMYAHSSEIAPDKLQFKDGNKPVVTEFKNRLCLLVRPNHKPTLITVSFKSSGLASAKRWNSLIQNTNLPAYARSYRLTPKPKVDGQMSWYIIWVDPDLFVPKEFFIAAKQYFEDMSKGGYRVDTTGLDQEESGKPESREPSDDEVPY